MTSFATLAERAKTRREYVLSHWPGETMVAIAKTLGISHKRVAQIIAEAGIHPTRPRPERTGRPKAEPKPERVARPHVVASDFIAPIPLSRLMAGR